LGNDLPALTVLVAQAASGGVLAVLAGAAVVLRKPSESLGLLAWAAGFGLPVVIALAILYANRATLGDRNAYILTALAAVGFLGFLIFTSLAVHNLIRAMEAGNAEQGR
jgi:hypothetical protein